jgi:hypothetical protein
MANTFPIGFAGQIITEHYTRVDWDAYRKADIRNDAKLFPKKFGPSIKDFDRPAIKSTIQITVTNWDRRNYHAVAFELCFGNRDQNGKLYQVISCINIGRNYGPDTILAPSETKTLKATTEGSYPWAITGLWLDKVFYSYDIPLQHPWSLCFVATAVYKNSEHPKVQEFRFLRDEVLAHSKSGTKFINWYNREGPKLAAVVERFPALRPVAKTLLSPMACGVKLLRKSGLIGRARASAKTELKS